MEWFIFFGALVGFALGVVIFGMGVGMLLLGSRADPDKDPRNARLLVPGVIITLVSGFVAGSALDALLTF